MADRRRITELPASCQAGRIMADWMAAVAAFRRSDSVAVADALSPLGLPDVEIYSRICGLTVIAAAFCGAEYRQQLPLDRPGDFYAFEIEDSFPDKVTDAASRLDQVNALAAARMVTAAANQDHAMLMGLVKAHLPVDGPGEHSGALLHLLSLFCGLTEERS